MCQNQIPYGRSLTFYDLPKILIQKFIAKISDDPLGITLYAGAAEVEDDGNAILGFRLEDYRCHRRKLVCSFLYGFQAVNPRVN